MDFFGRTPLIWASAHGMIELVALLLDRGAKTELTKTKDGCTALMEAVRKGRTATARLLLERGAEVNRGNRNGFTALFFACFSGPTILAMARGGTNLSIQSSEGQTEMVRLLIDAGADPNAATKDGFTPLMAACGEGYVRIVELLLEAGADTNAEHKRGSTAASFAGEEDHYEVIDILDRYASHTM